MMMINKKLISIVLLFTFLGIVWWEIYVPKFSTLSQPVMYTAKKGMGDEEIARDLKKQEIIKSSAWFRFYTIVSRQDFKLQAGSYELSESMSVAQIVKKFVLGDVIKNNITIVEGWNARDIGKYFESKNIYSEKEFLAAVNKDWCQDQSTEISEKFGARPSTQLIECSGFEFLKDKPKNSSLEGYIFPDTYEISGQELEDVLKNILANFDKKLTPDLRKEISLQRKSIFQIITMASILEKEVISQEDKKIVAGILWKRIKEGIPLQVDATVNYATGKHDQKVAISDTKIDSRYNTYKYYGLP